MDTAVILLIVLVVALIWRGPKTLPQLAAMLGRGVRQARRQLDGSKNEADGRTEAGANPGGGTLSAPDPGGTDRPDVGRRS